MSGTALHAGSIVSPVDVLALQMFTLRRGTAVAYCCAKNARGADYLVATRDGGTTWRVIGILPTRFNVSESYGLRLAFSAPDEGYVQSTHPVLTVMTDNAGRTWSALSSPGQPTGLSLAGHVLWITSDFCPTSTMSPELCPSRLLTYVRGSLRPTSEELIPTARNLATPGIFGRTREAVLLDRLGASSAVVEEGAEGLPSSLLFTRDSGWHWTPVADPCEGLVPTGLVAPSATSWDLYCQLDGGMNHGSTRFYTTSDQGKRWRLVAEGSIQGAIGSGMAFDLTLSGNGRVLWLLGAVSGVVISTDGGFIWTGVAIPTGGYDTELAVAGATGAWLPLPGLGLYHTTNATTWTRLGRSTSGRGRASTSQS